MYPDVLFTKSERLEFDPKNIVFEVVETQNAKYKEHLKNILNYNREKSFLITRYSSLKMIIDKSKN